METTQHIHLKVVDPHLQTATTRKLPGRNCLQRKCTTEKGAKKKKKKREKNVKKRDAAIVSRRNPNTVRYSTVLVSQHTFCRLLKPLVPNHRPDGFIYDIDDPHEVSNGKLSATNLVP